MPNKRLATRPSSPAHKILVVDDEQRFRDLYCQVLTEAGLEVQGAASAELALASIASERPALVVSDVRMPGMDGIDLLRQTRADWPDLPFLLVTAYSEVREAVQALRLGAVEYLEKPVDLDHFLRTVGEVLGVDNRTTDPEIPAELLEGIVAESPTMKRVLRDAYRVARSDVTVLLTGASGVGKDVVAQLVHRASGRQDRRLVSVNCGALPRDLVASSLFGHRRGAFTGAIDSQKGHFREADGGTLFLDEIGELPLELQPVLLRALDTGRIAPVGENDEAEVDVRLIAATNRDLESAVADGAFREDLYYRLNVIGFRIPALAERPEDLVPLATHFLGEQPGLRRRLSPAAEAAIASYHWPGNVREMCNAMTRAALLSRSEVILPEHLPRVVLGSASPADSSEPVGSHSIPTIEQSEIELIRRALIATGDNRTRAASLLGISRRGLLNKIKRHGL